MKIYPLVVGYCAYKRSVLERYQAFNDPEMPLEALAPAEQNRILNQLCLAVDEDLRQVRASAMPSPLLATDTQQAMREIAKCLETTWAAFVAQCRRRDQLVAMIRDRLEINDDLEYENFFFRHYGKLNDEERFQFDQIRAMTEGPLHDGNENMLSVLESHPQVFEEIGALTALRQHLVFWLNKYDRVFSKRPEMCLLYTGVEDQVPFPEGVDRQVTQWLKDHRQS